MMRNRVPQILVRGILGGSLVGLLIGAYIIVLTGGFVVQRDDFSHPLVFERAELRYHSTVLVSFVVVFAAIGPFIAAGSYGLWIRHAVYGILASIALVVAVTLVAAMITNQQPINMYKGSKTTCIDIARNYALPAAAVVGPLAGILIGAQWRRRRVRDSREHDNTT